MTDDPTNAGKTLRQTLHVHITSDTKRFSLISPHNIVCNDVTEIPDVCRIILNAPIDQLSMRLFILT